jgi:hypothetical protein
LYVEPYGLGIGCNLFLAWPQKNFQVSYFDSVNNEPCQNVEQGLRLNPNIQLTEISYMKEDQFDTCSYSGVECFDWPGFRE